MHETRRRAITVSMKPRRAQTPVHFRSDKAAAILASHVRPGRSQAAVIEEALERLDPDAARKAEIDERLRRLDAILQNVPRGNGMTMAEFDALEYDESGLPR